MYDVIIVGGGIAAFSAALFAARRGLDILVLAKDIGGQANYTDLIENYPGIEEVGGYELINKIKMQAEKFGARLLIADASKIKVNRNDFIVTAGSRQYKARSLILAYGSTPRDLGVPGEEELKGRGVSFCVNCDAPLYKKKTVAVVGIGDLNLEAALLLSRYAKKVYVLSKNDKLIGHPALLKAVLRKNSIEVIKFVIIESLEGQEQLSKMHLRDLKSGEKKTLAVDGLFVELGYVVDSKLVKGLLKLDELEQVVVDLSQRTSIEGIFAAGDAVSRPYKQAVISAGQGAAAALAAFDWLMQKEGKQGLTSDWTEIKRVKS
ncbi:MAG: FAD-dependent oxidoreductase [Candidatus Doudnabacteria bacterium]|nr:FAD-dependent oxidoreductase [Candidatus Doudnabacteria bacterium]